MPEDLVRVGDEQLHYHLSTENIWTSLDLTTDRGKLLLGRAMLPLAPKLDELVNTTIEIVDLVIQPQEGENEETGEIEQYSGITIIHPDDTSHWTGGKMFKRSLIGVMLYRGKPPWNPPIRGKIIQRSFTRKDGQPGRSYHFEYDTGSVSNKRK